MTCALCRRVVTAQGLCARHYMAAYRAGLVEAPITDADGNRLNRLADVELRRRALNLRATIAAMQRELAELERELRRRAERRGRRRRAA